MYCHVHIVGVLIRTILDITVRRQDAQAVCSFRYLHLNNRSMKGTMNHEGVERVDLAKAGWW